MHIATEGPLGWSALAAATQLKLPVSTGFHTNFHSYSKHYGIGFLKKPIASGLAVVAYEYAAARQCLVNEESGLLAPFGDSRTFVGMAAGLMEDSARIARLRLYARAAAERHD